MLKINVLLISCLNNRLVNKLILLNELVIECGGTWNQRGGMWNQRCFHTIDSQILLKELTL